MQTTTTDHYYDYYTLVTTNDEELQQLSELMAADDNNTANDTLYVLLDHCAFIITRIQRCLRPDNENLEFNS